MSERERGPWPILIALSALVCLVFAAFWPLPGFEFVDVDVREQVLKNPNVERLTGENLKHIFTSRCIESYYPVRTLTYAVNYHFWGPNAAAFKLTNGLIHLASVLLLFWLILRVLRRPATDGPLRAWDVGAAAFSAGVFAVHPVVVEPVAWVAGREELLMTLGALGCIHFHLSARRLEESDRRLAALACYAGAAFCCAAACLSNAVAAVIPLLIVAWDVLTLAGPKWRRIFWGTAALWAIGLATIGIKKLAPIEHRYTELEVFCAQRLMSILNLYWLNLRMLLWPKDLAFFYDQVRPESFVETGVILGGMAVGLTCLILWKLSRQKLVLFGLLWFLLALVPTAQIMPHHIHRADRFLYLPLVGLAVAIGAGLSPLRRVVKGPLAAAGMIAAGVLGLWVLVSLSALQLQTWQNAVSVWENCVRISPNVAHAHDSLADNLSEAGRFGRAIPHYEKAMALSPDRVGTLNNYAYQLASCDDTRLRDYDRAIRLATRACELTQWKDPKVRSTLAMVYGTFAESLAARSEFQRAIGNYRKALKVNPQDKISLFDLALLLATCRDERLRNPSEAIRLAEHACELTEHKDALGLMILGAAYAEAGQFEVAIGRVQEALRLAEAAGNAELAAELRYRLTRYRSGVAELDQTP